MSKSKLIIRHKVILRIMNDLILTKYCEINELIKNWKNQVLIHYFFPCEQHLYFMV